MFTRRIVDPTSKRALFSNAAIVALVGLVGSMLVLPLVGNSTPSPTITPPTAISILASTTDQDPGDFVLSGFGAGDLLVTIGLDSPLSGTTFRVVITEGLTRSYGYTSWSGVTEISFVASDSGASATTRANAALGSILVNTGSEVGNLNFKVSAMPSLTGVVFNPVNQHFYQVSSSTALWSVARTQAQSTTYDGVSGYLATIATKQENDFITSRIEGATSIWIGATDQTTEGVWRWVTGPEGLEDGGLGRQFWQGAANGTAISYASWSPGYEPNDGAGTGGQDYALTNWGSAGLWDDQNGVTSLKYLIEYSQNDSQTFTNLRTQNMTIPVVNSSITAPGTPSLNPNQADQAVGSFVLNYFPSGDLLVSVGLVSPPTGTTFRITTTEGLQRSFGYASWSGLTEISFVAQASGGNAQARANAALASLRVSTGNFGGPLTLKVSAIPNPSGIAFNPVNQHFYKAVTGSSVTQPNAVSGASGQTFDGVTGYLVTITTSQENEFVSSNIQGALNIWIGASDVAEGQWKWVTGPEGAANANAGTVFWTANCYAAGTCPSGSAHAGVTAAGLFASWANREPNNSGGTEDFAVTNWNSSFGLWNDLPSSASAGYVAEFSEWNSQQFASLRRAETTSTIPDPPAVTDNSGGSGGSSSAPTPSVTPSPTSPTGPSSNNPRPQPRPNPAPVQNPSLNPPAPLAGPVALPSNGSNGGGAVVQGEEVPLEASSSSEQALSVTAGEVNLNFSVPGGSGGVNSSGAAPELEVKRDKAVALEGEGMLPGSTVQVWLPGSNKNTELGRITVDEDGDFSGNVSFGSASDGSPLPIGPQVIQLTGVDRNGDQTVINLNINIDQPDPAPELFRGQIVTPNPGLGNFEASNAGLPEQATLTAITAQKQALIEGNGWELSLQLSGEGSGITENDNGVFMTLVRGEAATFGGNGFMPGTIATIWLFSDPTMLGEVTIAADGSFSGITGPLGTAIAAGEHTIQIQGVGEDGFIRSANLGVVVSEPLAAVGLVPFFDWLPLILLGLLIALGIFLAIAARRRKRSDGSNVIQFPRAA